MWSAISRRKKCTASLNAAIRPVRKVRFRALAGFASEEDNR